MKKWNFRVKFGQKKGKKTIEDQNQVKVIVWARKNAEKYDELKFLTASLNGVFMSVGQRMKANRSGLNKGTPDLSLPCARRGYHGLYIEMKTDDGILSSDQKIWRDFLKREKYFWYVCRNSDAAIRLLIWYLSISE